MFNTRSNRALILGVALSLFCGVAIAGGPIIWNPGLALSGGLFTGRITVPQLAIVNGALVLTGTVSATTTGFWGSETVSGAYNVSNSVNANQFVVNDSTTQTGSGNTHGYAWKYNFGGASLQGNHGGMTVTCTQTATSGNTGTGFAYSCLNPELDANVNDNGTGTSAALARGVFIAQNVIARAAAPATNLFELAGMEVNLQTDAGASMYKKVGIAIVQLHDDLVAGSVTDAGLQISTQNTGTPPGWTYGIQFGSADGNTLGPIAAAGTVLGCPTNCGTATTGVSLKNFTLTGNFLEGPSSSFLVSGAGAVSALSYAATALTAHGPLVGEAGSPMVAVTPGTSGKVLQSNGSSADPTYVSMRQVVSQTATAQQAANATSYYPCMGIAASAALGEVSANQPWALAGSFVKLYAQVDVAPGSGKTDTFTLRVNGSGTSVTCQVTDTNTTCNDTGHTASITAGQMCDIQVVTVTGGAAARMYSSLEFDNP